MYFDDPAEPFTGKTDPVEGALLVVAAAVISPLGWPLLGYLEIFTASAAKALF